MVITKARTRAQTQAERAEAAVTQMLESVGDCSTGDLRRDLATSKAIASKLAAYQMRAAAVLAARERHGDGGAGVLRHATGVSRRQAESQTRTARVLEEMPVVREALESGRVSFANAARLAQAAEKAEAGAVEADADLLARAESMPEDQFAREARRWTASHQPDDGEAEYQRRRARRWLRLWDGDDGMTHLRGELDPVTGERVRTRLETEARRLRSTDTGDGSGGGDGGGAGGGKRSFTQAMADALDSLTTAGASVGSPAGTSDHTGPARSNNTGPTRSNNASGRSSGDRTGGPARSNNTSSRATGNANGPTRASDDHTGSQTAADRTNNPATGNDTDGPATSNGSTRRSHGDHTDDPTTGNANGPTRASDDHTDDPTTGTDTDGPATGTDTDGPATSSGSARRSHGDHTDDPTTGNANGPTRASDDHTDDPATGTDTDNPATGTDTDGPATGNANGPATGTDTDGPGTGTALVNRASGDMSGTAGSNSTGGSATGGRRKGGANRGAGGDCDCGRRKRGGRPIADIAVVSHVDTATGELVSQLATGEPLPRSVLDLLSCNAALTGVLYDTAGTPLWRGTTKRTATAAQLRALIARDGGCVGCHCHPALCQAHHIRPAAQGGPTTVANMVLLCWNCHNRVHYNQWAVTRRDGRFGLEPPVRTLWGPARAP